MAEYTLYYFPARGRAEYARYALALAGVEYTDRRVTKDEWPELKPQMPFGQLPVLELKDGTKYAQGYTILRYLGRKYDLYGKTPEEAMAIDMIIDGQEDFNIPLIKFAREQDKDKKAEYKNDFEENIQDKWLEHFDKLLKRNNGGDGWLVGDSITIADLAFYHGTSWPMDVFGMTTPWAEFPKLEALKDKVKGHPKIAAWIKSRPESAW